MTGRPTGGSGTGGGLGLSQTADMVTVHIRTTRRGNGDQSSADSEPGERKRKGRPTEKRVAKLKEAQADVDARPFVDKAAPARVSSTHP